MHLKLHALLINKNILKINSLLIGCALWALFTSTRHTAIIISVPVAFYNTNTLHTITAPEKVALTLEGPCNILRTIDTKSLILHVDAQKLAPGMNTVALHPRNLLLPAEINLINCKHINCLVSL